MLKHAFASVMAAALLAAGGAVLASESPFPTSTNETTPFSFPAEGIRKAPASARMDETPYPSSVSESSPFSIPGKARMVSPDMLERTYGSPFPSSAIEVGGTL